MDDRIKCGYYSWIVPEPRETDRNLILIVVDFDSLLNCYIYNFCQKKTLKPCTNTYLFPYKSNVVPLRFLYG
jgi:hypothetical protein